MELLRVVFQQYRWPFLAVMALTMASAALGIGIIAFINVQLMGAAGNLIIVLLRVAASTLVATALWYGFESQILKLKARF